jgi:hypothetical protein
MLDEPPVTEIRRTPVDANAVRAYTSESQHTGLAFDLLRETSIWTIVLWSAYAGTIRSWNASEAVLAGHLIRLGKLLKAFLEHTQAARGELAWVTTRLAGECIINLRYLLLTRADSGVITSYVFHSLQHERELKATIDENIKSRAGVVLPIEQRMLSSIARTFRDSGVDPKDLPVKKIQNWGDKTLRQRAVALGLEDAYRIIIAAASRNVHGGWHDLLQHHLEIVAPTQFRPSFEDVRVRPQSLQALSILIVPGLIEYLDYLGTEETDQFTARLRELEQRVATANRLHEEFLVARQEKASADGT